MKAKRRFTEGARAAWATEKRGQYWADVYYDCDEETERYLDEGKEIPLFSDWFMERSEFVDLSHTPFYTGASGEMDSNPLEEAAVETGDMEKSLTSGKEHVEWGRYKGRPIVWILDNEYARGGGKMAIEVPLGERTKGSIAVDLFPLFLDEAKSVYITAVSYTHLTLPTT